MKTTTLKNEKTIILFLFVFFYWACCKIALYVSCWVKLELWFYWDFRRSFLFFPLGPQLVLFFINKKISFSNMAATKIHSFKWWSFSLDFFRYFLASMKRKVSKVTWDVLQTRSFSICNTFYPLLSTAWYAVTQKI